jgi:hypothetical protein
MSEVDASVSRMLTNYRDLIRRFVIGDIRPMSLRRNTLLGSKMTRTR